VPTSSLADALFVLTTMRLAPLLPLAAAIALSIAAPVHAENVTFTGFANGSQSVHFALDYLDNTKDASGDVNAGGFTTILNGPPSFETYCVDLYQHISFGTMYPEYSAPGTGHLFANSRAYTDLGRLYATAGSIDTSVREAAFQIAVWEIAYETTDGPYALGSGHATFTGGSAESSGALTLASTWLGALGDGPGRSILVLESGDHQDVIYAPVPEPETYALFLAGLGMMGFMARRRRPT
jgi:hypothetical protein